jgi:hypothetical protein
MLRFERALDGCLHRLEERYRNLHPDIDWSTHDEIESIASASGSYPTSSTTPGRVRFGGHVVQERNAEKLRTKVITLEQENQKLKLQLQQMEKLLAISGAKENQSRERSRERGNEEKKSLDEGHVTLTEGDIWNLVRSK